MMAAFDFKRRQVFRRLGAIIDYVVNMSVGRAVMAKRHHLPDDARRSLENRFNPPVEEIAHPAVDPQPGGMLRHPGAEKNALDATADINMNACKPG